MHKTKSNKLKVVNYKNQEIDNKMYNNIHKIQDLANSKP